MYGTRLGHMALSTNRYRSIFAEGIHIAGGSDAYITPIHPILGVHAAVNHPNQLEALEVGPALRMFAFGGPYAVSKENYCGTLEKGKEASFVILSDDPFDIDKADLRKILVDSVYKNGENIYNIDN